MRNVNALLEKRASRRAAATTATAATATVASSRARAARAPATHPAPAPGPARGASRRGAAASAHNAAVLAEASAAADLATNAGKAAAARAGTRRNPTLGSWAPPPSTRPERVGACGAQAVSHRDELDAAAAADAEAAAANAAEANLAAVAAAAASAKEIHEDGDEGADGGADEGAEEWEDVHEYDDEMIAADDAAGDDDDDADAGGSSSKGPARRMTSEERALLLSTHKTHVLCLMARAAAMDAAANDPLVLAVASSAVPRETAFALAGLGEGSNSRAKDALPEIRHVRALAKWFAGNVDVVDGEGFHTRRGERDQSSSRARKRGRKPVAVPLPPRARVRVEGGVIVLDGGDESARDEVDDDEVQIIENPSEATTRPSPTESPSPATDPARAKPEPARELVSDISAVPTERRRRLFAAAVRSAASAAATSLSARLAFAMARRGGTQEEAAALFVAAARGLGCRARTVAALDPTPLRASAATLEAASVLERHARASKGSKGSKGSKAKTNASMDSKAKTRALAADALAADADIPDVASRFSGSDARAVTRWAEVLCASETSDAAPRWVCVVPHAVGAKDRWSFATGAASVDDFGAAAAGRSSRRPAPYVVAFRPLPNVAGSNPTSDAFDAKTKTSLSSRLSRVGSSPAWGAKDVTRKYAETFSRVPPHRAEPEWWSRATAAAEARERASDARFDHAAAAACAAEDDDMDVRAKNERVPTTLAELRNHPLYVVERFLPPTRTVYPRKPLAGFVAGECVWPRSLVRELKSAERWKIEAHRAVRADQTATPHARAHSRASRARIKAAAEAARRERAANAAATSGVASEGGRGRGRGGARGGARSVEAVAAAMAAGSNPAEEPPGDIPLYGEWQTDPWDPPAAKNGVVPKNERGNVHLVGAKALPPPGTTHVNLPRITRVARTLRGCDYAPALVGFERRRGGQCAPKFEGIVVCAEWEERLRAAWEAAERERERAEAERRVKDAAKRWRVMLSAVWTRLSLREEFEGIDVAGTKSAGTGTSVPGTSVPGTSVPGESPVPDVTFTGGSGMMSVVAGGAVAEVEEM